MRPIRPQIERDRVPTCSLFACPEYRSSHRCGITGERPGEMCRPAIEQMAAELTTLRLEARERAKETR